MSKKTEVFVTAHIRALHSWNNAPNERAYLRHPHTHLFKITAWYEVDHADRDLELHDLSSELTGTIASIAMDMTEKEPYYDGDILTFGGMSCEMIGEEILLRDDRVSRVQIEEEDGLGAIVYREEE